MWTNETLGQNIHKVFLFIFILRYLDSISVLKWARIRKCSILRDTIRSTTFVWRMSVLCKKSSKPATADYTSWFFSKLFTSLLNVPFVGAVRVFHNPRLISKSGLFFSNKQPYCHVLVWLANKIWKHNVCTQKSPYTVREKLFFHFCFD